MKLVIFKNKEVLRKNLENAASAMSMVRSNSRFSKFVGNEIMRVQLGNDFRVDLQEVISRYKSQFGTDPWTEMGLETPDFQELKPFTSDGVNLEMYLALPFLDPLPGEMNNSGWDITEINFCGVAQFVHPDHLLIFKSNEGPVEASKSIIYDKPGWFVGYSLPDELQLLGSEGFEGIEDLGAKCYCRTCIPTEAVMCQSSFSDLRCSCKNGQPCPGNCVGSGGGTGTAQFGSGTTKNLVTKN